MARDREPKDAVTAIRLVPLRRADGASDASAKEKRTSPLRRQGCLRSAEDQQCGD